MNEIKTIGIGFLTTILVIAILGYVNHICGSLGWDLEEILAQTIVALMGCFLVSLFSYAVGIATLHFFGN